MHPAAKHFFWTFWFVLCTT